MLKHQILISHRSRQRAPNLTTLDRVLIGLTTPFVSPRRIAKPGALVQPLFWNALDLTRKLDSFAD